MNLFEVNTNILRQLREVIGLLDDTAYRQPVENLSAASLGQHVRHIIEFYQCFLKACRSGELNYDNRERKKLVEESKLVALNLLEQIEEEIASLNLSQVLIVEVNYGLDDKSQPYKLSTTAGRELIYNIEHAIHHMALIKVGIREICTEIDLPTDFGVAHSTIRNQQRNRACMEC